MSALRQPAVAGLFYPDDPTALREQVSDLLDAAPDPDQAADVRAAIGPHAGYSYSGPTCGVTYAALRRQPRRFARVLLIGPSHRVPFSGLGTSSAQAFASPLGNVPVDRHAVAALEQHATANPQDPAHAPEHGLEVHLPFIQLALGHDLPIVPVLFSNASARDTAAALEPVWTDDTLLMVSSDLSHFHADDEAKRIDRATADAIEQGHAHALSGEAACGHVAIQALMLLARERGLTPQTLDLRTSGDTAGPRDRVVGYGAFIYA